MRLLTSLLVLAFQTVLGAPSHAAASQKSVIDSYIEAESTVALNGVLCNIGANGCHSSGVSAGVVIASPDHTDPPYFYSWTRDSALTFKALVDRFIHQFDYGLQGNIHDYIAANAKIQGISNPSGSLADGAGLGEPKFNVDETAFTGAWGRPQRDGPALRAITSITYGNWLISQGHESVASDIIWPIVRNDLNYVAQYWNQTGFDLWEEVNGSSFFTIASQHRALVEGAKFATSLGQRSTTYSSIAPQLLCFLQSFWVPEGGYIDSNINVNEGRTGKDADSVLGSIHTFDPSLGCDPATFQPCSDKALSNLKALVDSFRFYEVNKGIPVGKAIALGRYSEDVYYDGNPWYLNTLAAAELIYDALYVWEQQGSIAVTGTSLAFFRDLVPSVSAGTYKKGSSTYTSLYGAASAYADGFVAVVQKYQGSGGALSEQFSKDNGTALSAHDLTWSYASFLTASARRAGQVPPSWFDGSASKVPSSCSATSVKGSYATATRTSFPPGLTPTTGAPPPPSSTSSAACPTATSVAVTFEETVTTSYGQTVKIVGNVPELGSWDTSKAIALDASQYTPDSHLWQVTVTLPAGESIQYKYINVASGGAVTWEADPNHLWTVPKTCKTTAVKQDAWQS